MFIECNSATGFEDQLSQGRMYQVKGVGKNSFYILNDAGQKRWYGMSKFNVAPVNL